MSNKMAGRINNEPESRMSQGTSRLQEVIGRVNNELDKNTNMETAAQKKEIGRVNNKLKPAVDHQKTPESPVQIIGRVHNE